MGFSFTLISAPFREDRALSWVDLRVPWRGNLRSVDKICPSSSTLPGAVELRAALGSGAGEGSALLISSPLLFTRHTCFNPARPPHLPSSSLEFVLNTCENCWLGGPLINQRGLLSKSEGGQEVVWSRSSRPNSSCVQGSSVHPGQRPAPLVSVPPSTHYPAFQCRVWGSGRVVQPRG